MSSHTKRTEFYLFGHQISHSASPAFHNEIFSALDLSQHRYQLHDTKHPQNEPNSRMLEVDAGWHGVQGVESMIQQGFEQSRAWLLSSAASPFQGQRKGLGNVVEDRAAALVRGMEDIKPVGCDSQSTSPTSPTSAKLAPQKGARFGQARL